MSTDTTPVAECRNQGHEAGRIQEQQEQLERMIDSGSLAGLLENLEAVCYQKAEHLRVNWQNEPAARAWELVARRIAKTADAALGRGI